MPKPQAGGPPLVSRSLLFVPYSRNYLKFMNVTAGWACNLNSEEMKFIWNVEVETSWRAITWKAKEIYK
jgi:hypothetical protein